MTIWKLEVNMLSQFFYLPANQKIDEEKRIAFTQEKIKLVKDFLSQHFLSARYKNGHPFEFDEKNWQVYVGEQVVINQNYWNAKIDEFQSANRCKIEQLDYLYLLKQLWRDVNGRSLSIADGTLGVSLYMPKKKIVQKKEPVKPATTQEIKIKINPKKFRITKYEHLLDNGKVYTDYRPQKKGWFFWNNFWTDDPEYSGVISFDTIEKAEKYLVDYIRLNGYIGETIIFPSGDLDASVI